MRDAVTLNYTHPLQESVTASQASQVDAETNGNADAKEEQTPFSFSANPSTQWQATRDVKVEEEKKASRAFGVPPNAEESGGSPNPLENAEENEPSNKQKTRRRSATLSLHLTPKEKEDIVKNAKRAKRSVTDFVVDASRGAQFIECEDLHGSLLELKRIGNNVNQIARKINSGEAQVESFHEFVGKLETIKSELYMIVRRFYGDG